MGLRSLSRTDRLLFGILLLTAALATLMAWLLAPPEKTGGMEKQPSTLYNAAYGVKAGYELLGRLGYPVARLRRPIEPETLKGIGTLFVLKPWIGLADHEVDVLKKWIKQGHALVVAPGRSSGFSLPGSSLKEWFRFADADEASVGKQECLPRDALTAGIKQLVVRGDQRFDFDSPLRGPLSKMTAQAFWKDQAGIIGLHAKFGNGAMVALADTYPLSNLGISEADNGLLLANLARELSDRYPGQIAFDEYHLGFAQRDWSSVAIAKLMLGGEWRWAEAQAALVGISGAICRQRAIRASARHCLEAPPAASGVRGGGRSAAERGRGRLAGRRNARPLLPRPSLPASVSRTRRRRRAAWPGGPRALGPRHRPDPGRGPRRERGCASRQKLLAISQQLHRTVEALDHGT